MSTPLYLLRCKQAGFSLFELKELSLKMVSELFVEQGNDHYDYPLKATANDIEML